MADRMPPYERAAWSQLEAKRRRELAGPTRRYLPAAVAERAAAVTQGLSRSVRELPGADAIKSAVMAAIGGLDELGNRVVATTVEPEKIMAAYRRAGHDVERLADLRWISLEQLDAVRPRFDLRYGIGSALQGAVAASIVTGTDVLATGETVASAGVAAAPAALLVLTAVAADAVGVLLASQRAVAQVAAYYGFDVTIPEERIISAAVIGVGIASTSGKAAAYRELNAVVQGLARHKTWAQLNQHAATKVVQQIFNAFGFKLTKERLAETIPVLGIVIASGMNARTLISVVDSADGYYRARLLSERYGVTLDLGTASEPSRDDDEPLLMDILDAELADEPVEPAADDEHPDPKEGDQPGDEPK